MCDHEGGYNRFEGYVSSKLRELGNKLIEDSHGKNNMAIKMMIRRDNLFEDGYEAFK